MSAPVDQQRWSNQSSPRTGPIVRMVWHHQASTNDDATIQMMVSGSRQVSSTWTVSNDDPGGRGWSRITAVVPEDRRPWTTSSATVDGPALTVECANSTGAPGWGIADASVEACARLAAYAFTQYGVPLRRITSQADLSGHIGHNECMAVWPSDPGLYATACQMNLSIDRILSRAAELVGAAIPQPVSDLLGLEMFMLSGSTGVYLISAGYARGMTAEEFGQVSGIPGIVTFHCEQNDRARDVILSACQNGVVTPPPAGAVIIGGSTVPLSASLSSSEVLASPQSVPVGDAEHDGSEH